LNPQTRATARAVAAAPASIRPSLGEILQVRWLLQQLTRPRNTTCWSPAQRAALRLQLRRLARISPYLVVLVLPGSVLMLPLMWWLERRRGQRRAGTQLPKI
jgi:hypothetical protein